MTKGSPWAIAALLIIKPAMANYPMLRHCERGSINRKKIAGGELEFEAPGAVDVTISWK